MKSFPEIDTFASSSSDLAKGLMRKGNYNLKVQAVANSFLDKMYASSHGTCGVSVMKWLNLTLRIQSEVHFIPAGKRKDARRQTVVADVPLVKVQYKKGS